MSKQQPYLSKSRLISAWQCEKKLNLEVHRPELADISHSMESAFSTGHDVGRISQQVYGGPDSIEIPYGKPRDMLLATKRAIDSAARSPIFEATFVYDGVLVRVDVLIPEGATWRAIEIKASTSVKPVHVIDCAIQLWVMRNSGLNISSIGLGHIDNQFEYKGQGNYAGIFKEQDLTAEAAAAAGDVTKLVDRARDAIVSDTSHIPVGVHCNKPYDCQFMSHCWPMDAEYPVTGLGGGKARLAGWVNAGYRDIRDIGTSELAGDLQKRIRRVTKTGEAELLPGAKPILDALSYPRYYLDFETIGPAVPVWAGMRPYAAVPIQWSCHVEGADGELSHEEFLDISGGPPMRALAESMIECLGDSGPVLMYTSYEKSMINGLIAMFPDLADSLTAIVGRLFDLHPVVKAHYYHPNMLGSWSIKAVLPCIAPHMSYANLEGIKEGTAASNAYLEAINSATPPERKRELQQQLLRYCRFDTEAMVKIVRSLT